MRPVNRIPVLLIILAFWLTGFFQYANWGNKKGNDSITWDTYGYYLYLPAFFIYDDPGLERLDWVQSLRTKYEVSSTLYQIAPYDHNGKHILKYSSGLAFVYLPGFLVAHALAPSMGFEQDGLSKPYQVGVACSSYFWILLGLFLLSGLLHRYFSPIAANLALICTAMATNLYEIATIDPHLVHGVLFGMYVLVYWLSIKWVEKKTWLTTLGLGFFIGWCVLIRPTSALLVLIPVLLFLSKAKSVKDALGNIIQSFDKIIAIGILITGIFSIQMMYWKFSGGNWFIYSYTEGFDWLTPYIIPFLFSFKKGWLIYTPIMIFALSGFFLLLQTKKPLYLTLVFFCLVFLYVMSCWETWWYGGSFSQRAMVESLGFWAFGFAAFFQWLQNKRNRILWGISLTLLGSCIYLNIFQSNQYYNGIIDPERMTKAYYSAVFLNNERPDNADDLLEVDRVLFSGKTPDLKKYTLSKTYLIQLDSLNGSDPIQKAFADAWQKHMDDNQTDTAFKNGLHISPGFEFSDIAKLPYYLFSGKDHFWLKGTLTFRYKNEPKTNPFALVGSFHHGERTYQYMAYGTDTVSQPLAESQKIDFWYITPHLKNKTDDFHFYFWNYGKADALIESLALEIWEPNVSHVSW